MKKLIIAIMIMMILAMTFDSKKEFTLLDYFTGEYTAYADSVIDDGIDLGFCYMGTTAPSENIIGESMKINNLEIGHAIDELNARVVDTEYLECGTIVIYAFTDKIEKSVNRENKKINLQIAHNDEYSVIGWPLIIGSF